MKFAKKTPYMAMVIEDQDGVRYLLDDAENWQNLWILKNNGSYCVTNADMKAVEDTSYVDVKKVGTYLLAYFLPKEKFHIFDENGNRQVDENGNVIMGICYQEAENKLLVGTEDNDTFFFKDQQIQHLREGYILTTSVQENGQEANKFVAVIKQTYDNKIEVEKEDSQEVLEDVGSEPKRIEVSYYYENTVQEKKWLKIILGVKDNMYATSFMLGNDFQFIKLDRKMIDPCPECPYHIMYEDEYGKKILHDVSKNKMFHTRNEVDGFTRVAYELDAEFFFWIKYNEKEKIYVEVWSEANNKLAFECYTKNISRLDMVNQFCEKKYNAWIGYSFEDEIHFFTKEDSVKCKFVKDYQAKDNYVLLKQRVPGDLERFSLYKITDQIECIFKETVLEKEGEYPNIFVGTEDIVVISEENQRSIYYKWILLKREINDGSKYLQNDFLERQCHENWGKIKAIDGFIDVPEVGKYFVDFEKSKAYSVVNPMYWIKYWRRKSVK